MKKLFNALLAIVLGAFVFSTATYTASAANLPKVISLKSYNIDDDEINLKWEKVKGADGYQVKVYTDGQWKSLGRMKKTSFEADDLRSTKSYKFKVRAYELKGSKRVYGKYSSVLTAATDPDEVENVKVSSKAKNSVSLQWSKVPGATRYQVYLYDSAKGKYVRKATVKSNSATVKELKTGTAYKFKVRAYFKSNGKKYYGDFFDVLSAKTKGAVSQTASSSKALIGKAKAESVALSHAGLKKSQVRAFNCKLDREDGVQVYEVEFEYGRYDYEYCINANTGKILNWEKDRD